jgi:hypothetical protein
LKSVEDADVSMPATPLRVLRRRVFALIVFLVTSYLMAAYLLAPRLWRRYVRHHPALADLPGITRTASGVPADPLNVALTGTREEVLRIVLAAKWFPADPLTLRSSWKIARAAVLKHPYDDAPVSNLFLFGRKEDLAFEQPIGGNPRERHHVRFWKTERVDIDGRPVWIGAAIFDRRVGLSRTTGQITHITAPDVDTERDYLIGGLQRTGGLLETYVEDNFHTTLKGKNGGGDPWYTDGALHVGVIKPKSP